MMITAGCLLGGQINPAEICNCNRVSSYLRALFSLIKLRTLREAAGLFSPGRPLMHLGCDYRLHLLSFCGHPTSC
jgi:hypothetical protein